MMEVVLALIVGLITNEIHVCMPAIARWIVRRRAAKLPADLGERMREEWLAEVDACQSHIQKLVFSLGLFFGTRDLLQAHTEQTEHNAPTQSQMGLSGELKLSGDVTVTLNGVSATGSVGNVTPLTWQNNSMFEAANVVIRDRHARRAAHIRNVASSGFTSPVL